jgi:AcrR family transcriptional regulator
VVNPKTNLQDGRARILVAALEIFASTGFDGSSLRQIAQHAGVQHQLVVYHFKTKDALWRQVVSSIRDEVSQEQAASHWDERVKLVGPADAMREMLRAFALFAAKRPEFHRLLYFEVQANGDRLTWLIDTFVRPLYDISTRTIRAAQDVGQARSGDAGRLHYAVIGVITNSLVFANEYRRMTGIDPFLPAEVEKAADLAADLLGLPLAGGCPL